MTLQEIKTKISDMDNITLVNQCKLYRDLVSSSTSDQIYLSLLEQEITKRNLI